jgi:hypothetical protein
MAAKFGFLSSRPKSRKPVDFLLELDEAERAVVEHDDSSPEAVLL